MSVPTQYKYERFDHNRNPTRISKFIISAPSYNIWVCRHSYTTWDSNPWLRRVVRLRAAWKTWSVKYISTQWLLSVPSKCFTIKLCNTSIKCICAFETILRTNKRIFTYTALTDWFCKLDEVYLLTAKDQIFIYSDTYNQHNLTY
jgi:hypothetical protein